MAKIDSQLDAHLWLQQLHNLIIRYFDNIDGFATACIDTGLRMLKLTTGIVSKIEDDDYFVVQSISPLEGLSPGSVFKLADTYCSDVVNKGQTLAYHNVGQLTGLGEHPVYLNTGLNAYIGAPIAVDGGIYGTLNFSDNKARNQPFSREELYIVESMASLMGRFIERQKREEELHNSKQFFELAFKHGIVGKAIAAVDGTIIDANEALLRMLEYSREEVVGKTPKDFTHPDDLDLADAHYAQLFGGHIDHFFLNKRYLNKYGRVIEGDTAVGLVRDTGSKPAYLVLQLIDRSNERAAFRDLEAANSRLSQLSLQDALTNIPNRRAFDEQLERALADEKRNPRGLTLVLFDIDHFKKVNDQFGHQAGDEVLTKLASILRNSLRVPDMAARVGGEEFALILQGAALPQARIVVERLRAQIVSSSWSVPKLTCSFGVACYSSRWPDTRSFYRAADQALYEAKASGRDRVCCFQ